MLRNSLKGIKIVDFSQIAAGPTCSMLLADLGASVVKVEPPGGDLGRTLGPGWVGSDSALFHALNRNKQGICLDLKAAEGVQIARRLAAQADVLIESMRPGVMQRLGLGYAQLGPDFPRLIYCSISAYGQEGPYADRAGVDGILQADTGLMSIIGIPDTEPCKVQAPIVDVITGHIACTGILAKLMQRASDGRGGHLDVNLMNSAISLQSPAIASYLSDRVLPMRIGSAAPYSAPNEAFETSDGWIMVAAYMGDRWARLCDVIERPELIHDERLTTSRVRTTHRPHLRAAMNAAFRQHSTAYWLPRLLAEDILCAKVGTYEDLAEHPQVRANQTMVSVDIPGYGLLTMPGFPINSREENTAQHKAAPRLGENSREILQGCDLTDAEIDRMLTNGVVQ